MTLTDEQKAALLAQYESWTGGWGPEDEQQVDEFMEVACPADCDTDEAYEFLLSQIGK
jgi:hypothetical protein